MPGLDVRSFEAPSEELADLEKAEARRLDVGGRSVWRFVFEPGWRYTEHEAGAGAIVVIEPGHDAWTVGDEPCVFIDFGESLA
jgi:hypothetical protein